MDGSLFTHRRVVPQLIVVLSNDYFFYVRYFIYLFIHSYLFAKAIYKKNAKRVLQIANTQSSSFNIVI